MKSLIKKTSKFIKRTSKKAGMAPGTVVHIGERKIEETKITLINYDQTQLEEKQLEKIEGIFPYKDTLPVTWINIDGLHEVEIIEKIGQHFCNISIWEYNCHLLFLFFVLFGRSPAIVIAYLMKCNRWRLPQSLQWVKDRRPVVDLTSGILTPSVSISLHYQF